MSVSVCSDGRLAKSVVHLSPLKITELDAYEVCYCSGLDTWKLSGRESKASCRLNAVLPERCRGAEVSHFQGMPDTKSPNRAKISAKISAIHRLANG